MKTVAHNKLVRNMIPQIIQQSGKEAVFSVLEQEQYIQCLNAKLTEEVAEYQESHEPEELADILEVVYALAQTQGVSAQELEGIRKQKAEKRGGFEERIFLKEVHEK